jgi:integrase
MRIPYLTYKRLANGETAYYFNIPARLIPAGCLVKSQPLGTDYIKACQKALELYEKLKAYKKIEENIETKSFGFLWSLYIQSRFYIELSERTKKDYSRVYDLICQKENKSGQKLKDIPLDLFDSDSAYKLYQRFIESYRERWAKYCISILRLVYNFGMRKEILTRQNPFENMRIKNVRPKKRFIPAEHIQALIEKANELDLRNAALAIALNFYICQRPADVLKLRKKDLYQKDGYYFFNIVQNKTGANVHVPVPPELLDEILNKTDYIICNKHGKPYDVNVFGHIFKKINDACGFDYTFRLLRHAGSTAYAEAGVNTSAVISLTGHTNEQIFNQVYKGNSEQLSLHALQQRLEAEKRSNNVPFKSQKVRMTPEKKSEC